MFFINKAEMEDETPPVSSTKNKWSIMERKWVNGSKDAELIKLGSEIQQ